MSEEEEIVVQPPPKKILGMPATKDAHLWAMKWSTWLAVFAVMLDAAAMAFMAGPPEWRSGFPALAGVGLLGLSMLVKGLIPLATSIQQKAPQS